jgi:hypothetical protein
LAAASRHTSYQRSPFTAGSRSMNSGT